MKDEHKFKRKKHGAVEMVPSTYKDGYSAAPFLDRPKLDEMSEVAICKCVNYAGAEDAVREAIHLLGGVERFIERILPGVNQLFG